MYACAACACHDHGAGQPQSEIGVNVRDTYSKIFSLVEKNVHMCGKAPNMHGHYKGGKEKRNRMYHRP